MLHHPKQPLLRAHQTLVLLACLLIACGDAPSDSPSPTSPSSPTPDSPTATPSPVPAETDCDFVTPTPDPGPPSSAPPLCNGQEYLYVDLDNDGYGGFFANDPYCHTYPHQVRNNGDCNDYDDTTYPGALELCDGKDHNCDLVPIDPDTPRYFADQDHDGFGTDDDTACTPAPGYTSTRGDCDDADPAIHAGALDHPGDQQDSDCGGSDWPEPHVGVNCRSYPKVQQAILAALPGATLWVAPGTYLENISLEGKDLTLRGLWRPETVTLTSGGMNSTVQFINGEGTDAVLEGFTVSGGNASFGWNGGGIRIMDSSPTLRNLIIRDNVSSDSCPGNGLCEGGAGGGISLERSAASLRELTFLNNRADVGGALAVQESDLAEIAHLRFYTNTANLGGGIAFRFSDSPLEQLFFQGNTGYNGGGAVSLEASSPLIRQITARSNGSGGPGAVLYSEAGTVTLEDSSFQANYPSGPGSVAAASGHLAFSESVMQSGGGYQPQLWTGPDATFSLANLSLQSGSGHGAQLEGSGTFRDSTLQQNAGLGVVATGAAELTRLTLSQNGGGALLSGTVRLENSLITSNLGTYPAVLAPSGSPIIRNSTIVGNRTTREARGGGISYTTDDSPGLLIEGSIVAYNWGYNLATSDSQPGTIQVRSSCLYNPVLRNHPLSSLDDSNLETAPDFFLFLDDGDPTNDDLHLASASPLKTLFTLPSGSTTEAGAYGGPDADRSYYLDADADALYDGWEERFGLNTTQKDGSQDPDSDGLTNLREQDVATHPAQSDTDSDGTPDGAEVSSGSSPHDWYSQPGEPDPVAHVPGDFSSLQSALSAIQDRGVVEVTADITASAHLWNKGLELRSAPGTLHALNGAGTQVLELTATELAFADLTLSGGYSTYGGGLEVSASIGTLERIGFSGNGAEASGGGLASFTSTLTLTDPNFQENTAQTSGGGLYGASSTLTLSRPILEHNTSISGGGLALYDSQLHVSEGSFRSNGATSIGAGAALVRVSGTLEDTRFASNGYYYGGSQSSSLSGGGLYVSDSAVDVLRCRFESNQIQGLGGGIYASGLGPRLRNCIFQGNRAGGGGGVYLFASPLDLQFCTLVDNEGGGIQLYGKFTPMIKNNLLAYNAPYNLAIDSPEVVKTQILYNDLYNADGRSGLDPDLDLSNLKQAPGLITWTNNQNISDDNLHLTLGSPLIDAAESGILDPDGSPADIGAYGGPDADFSYYADLDGDTLYDAWERTNGLDPTRDDSSEDFDGDGLTNLEELQVGTAANQADSDHDAVNDGAEQSTGSNPLDFYSQPGVAGYATANVPQNFSSIQAAINAMWSGGIIEVEPGTRKENITIAYKDVVLLGIEGPEKTTLSASSGTVLTGKGASLVLDGFTVQGPLGIVLSGGSASLSHLRITSAISTGLRWGGGTYVLSDSRIENNTGLALDLSGGTVLRTEVRRNTNILGATVELYSTEVRYSEFSRNQGQSCAIQVINALTLDHSALFGNVGVPTDANDTTLESGMCITSTGGTVKIYNSVVAYNTPQNLSFWYGVSESRVQILSSDFYAPSGTRNLPTGYALDASNTTVEPQFLSYGIDTLPTDLHPALTSPLIGLGTENDPDADGSPGDAGIYGGAEGDTWDRDQDDLPDYFWPGTLADSPDGIDPSDFDCDDLDPQVGSGPCASTRASGSAIPSTHEENR